MGLLMFEVLKKNKELRIKIREKFPGVLIKYDSSIDCSLSITEKNQLLEKEYEELSDKLKKVHDRLYLNHELSLVINRNLDWLYTMQEAQYYIENINEFKDSFAEYNGELHSAEYIVREIESNDLITVYAYECENQTVVLCNKKKLDCSDKFFPKLFYEKTMINLSSQNPKSFTETMNRIISQIPNTVARKLVVHKNG